MEKLNKPLNGYLMIIVFLAVALGLASMVSVWSDVGRARDPRDQRAVATLVEVAEDDVT